MKQWVSERMSLCVNKGWKNEWKYEGAPQCVNELAVSWRTKLLSAHMRDELVNGPVSKMFKKGMSDWIK